MQLLMIMNLMTIVGSKRFLVLKDNCFNGLVQN